MNGYSMRLKDARSEKRELEIFIYSDIGSSWWMDGLSADQFRKDLRAAGEVDLINVRINSAGGDVADGNAIYNLLRQHKAEKIVDIDGMALSIASIIAMSGDTVRMADNAMFMIHDPWTGYVGNAEDFRKQADIMDQFKEGLVGSYAKKTGLDRDTLWDWMADETWFTAKEAAEHGFVDEVTDAVELNAYFDPRRFKNVPAHLVNKLRNSNATPRLDQMRTRIARMEQKLRTSLPANPQ